ncbi:MAG: polysaccharide lyase 6 family protein [Stenotrophomonas maltophilia]
MPRLLLKGQGTAAAPIVLRAQTAGKVVLSGRSDLRLAGNYLQVSNLVFRNGYAPGDAVVAFRESSKAVASNSRVTGLVIDDYTNPDASDQDYWVSLYGSNNRLDHSQLRGKTNAGPTVVVVRDATQGLDNQHRIDHNWFGPRPALGVNGGETIRVGTSDSSLSDSNSTVENNWFEGCDGETEIISNKSGGNTYRGNVFYRSAGALTLRHGNGNRVIDNVFLGDDKAGTGGVRIINADQTVSNNYFERLAGSSNRSALAVMDAQASPPLSGYAPVVNATINRNTFVDVAKISFGVGHDEAKGIVVAASSSRFTGNLIVNRNSSNPPNCRQFAGRHRLQRQRAVAGSQHRVPGWRRGPWRQPAAGCQRIVGGHACPARRGRRSCPGDDRARGDRRRLVSQGGRSCPVTHPQWS